MTECTPILQQRPVELLRELDVNREHTATATAHPLVFIVANFMTTRGCEELAAHADKCEEMRRLSGLSIDPTVFHSGGVASARDLGLEAWAQAAVSDLITPLARDAFRRRTDGHPFLRRGLDPNDFFLFYLRHDGSVDRDHHQTPCHVDESVVTFVVPLDEPSPAQAVLQFALPSANDCDTFVDVPLRKGTAVMFVGSATPHRAVALGGGNEPSARRELVFYCVPRLHPQQQQRTHRVIGGETATSNRFYSRYELYLQQKYARLQGADNPCAAAAFDIPTLPAAFSRIAQGIADDAFAQYPQLAQLIDDDGVCKRDDGGRVTTFLWVQELVVEVAQYLPNADLGVMSRVCNRWNGFLSDVRDARCSTVWNSRHERARREAIASRGGSCGSGAAAVDARGESTTRGAVVLSCGGIGNAVAGHLWELLSLGAGLDTDGFAPSSGAMDALNSFNSFFSRCAVAPSSASSSLRWKPNAVIVDLDEDPFAPSAYDSMATSNLSVPVLSRWRRLFTTGGECVASCAGGNPMPRIAAPSSSSCSSRVAETVRKGGDLLRRQLEALDKCTGVVGICGYGGGTGPLISEILDSVYLSRSTGYIECPVLPSFTRDAYAHLAAYNCVLGLSRFLSGGESGRRRGAQIAMLFANDSLHAARVEELAHQLWGRGGGGGGGSAAAGLPHYDPYASAEFAARGIEVALCNLASDGAVNLDVSELITNTVPYESLCFGEVSYRPPRAHSMTGYACAPTLREMTEVCFDARSRLGYVAQPHSAPRLGRFMSCTLQFQGDVVPKDVMAAVASIKTKRTIQFVDWCPTGFKCGISYHPPVRSASGIVGQTHPMPRSVAAISNHTEIGTQTVATVGRAFDRVFAKRSFVHHYIAAGLEDGSMSEAREALAVIEKDYEECAAFDGREGGEGDV